MAKADVITKSGNELEESVLELMQLVKLCRSLDALDEHPWLYVMGRHADRVEAAAEAYVVDVNTVALPHLRDLDSFAAKGGMGAVAPMVTRVTPGQSTSSRA